MRSRAIVTGGIFGAALLSGGWLLHGGGLQVRGVVAHGRRVKNVVEGQRLLDTVMTLVERTFVDTVSRPRLYREAVDGVLYELHDPHSSFLTPERERQFDESTSGLYAGVGVQTDVRDGWLTVVAPVPNSPAALAGVQTGDRIVEFDHKVTHGWTQEEASKAFRGAPGTEASFLVERPGVGARIPFRIKRAVVHSRAVPRVTMLRPGIGYVDVKIFGDSTARELVAAVDSLRRAGMRSLVLDLRGNPGGLVAQGVGVADLFLEPGQEIVRLKGRTGIDNQTVADRAPQHWPTLPVVVLVNQGSASASEIVAGALQDHDRAVVVGSTSYGKGSAQSVFPMGGDGALKLTTSLWYTPSGRSINRPSVDAEDEDAPPPDTVRPKFRTDAGRTVLGGGGITPDLIAGDTAPSDAELLFQHSLGRQLPRYRDALTAYALELRASHAVATPGFVVTPAMRDALWQRMKDRGVEIPRAAYDGAESTVVRQLGSEIARYVFGGDAEFLRTAAVDPVILEALRLLDGADRAELLRRGARRPGRNAATVPAAAGR